MNWVGILASCIKSYKPPTLHENQKHATQSMQVQMGILDEWVFDILYTQWHEKSNYKGLETNTRNRVLKSSCRTAKRLQPDQNRTKKDQTAVTSCLASATDQLQVASFCKNQKTGPQPVVTGLFASGCMSKCSTRLGDSNGGPIV
jgi:hypothetical protein